MSGFLINHTIYFDSDICMIHSISNPSARQTLNIIASRCLTSLLENQGKVLSREELLQIGWGSSGIVVAPNTLNQVISQIRKSFKIISEQQDIITTVSREGYLITKAIKVERLDPPKNEPLQNLTPITINVDLLKCDKNKAKKITQILPFVVLLLAVVITFYFYSNDSESIYVIHDNLTYDNKFHFQKGLDIEGQYLKAAITLIQTDNDMQTLKKTYPEIYINNTVRTDVFSFFLCNGKIEDIYSKCIPYIYIENGKNK